VKQLSKFVVGNLAGPVLSEMSDDEITVEVESNLTVECCVLDNVFKLI